MGSGEFVQGGARRHEHDSEQTILIDIRGQAASKMRARERPSWPRDVRAGT